MISKKRITGRITIFGIIFVFVFLVFSPTLINAQNFVPLDVIAVGVRYIFVPQGVEIISVVEKGTDETNVEFTTSGDYELSLLVAENSKPLAVNYFNSPKSAEVDVVGSPESKEEGAHIEMPSIDFSVMLPLLGNYSRNQLALRVSKNGVMVSEKKLSDIPFEFINYQTYRISEAPVVFPPTTPFEEDMFFNRYKLYIWGGIGILVLIIVIILGIFIWRRKKKNLPQIPTQPTPPSVPPTNPPTPPFNV